MRFGPQTGAGDGNKEFKAQTQFRGLKTGSNWKAEEQKARRDAAKARRAEKRAEKQAKKNGW